MHGDQIAIKFLKKEDFTELLIVFSILANIYKSVVTT